MDAVSQKIVMSASIDEESHRTTYPRFKSLKERGLKPLFVTMDGHRHVMRAVKEIWPQTKIQRCLFHIKREGMRWLRTYPKTVAGQELRGLLAQVCSISSIKERDDFINSYNRWKLKHRRFVRSLPGTDVAFKDLKKTMALIDHALPDMFHYLNEPNVPATTNTLEGYFSRLKGHYRKHRGLSSKHK